MLSGWTATKLSVIALSLAQSYSVRAAGNADCKQLEFTEDFSNGFSQRWKQLAGAEYDKSITPLDGGGVALNLRTKDTGNTQMVSKALFQSASVEVTMKTNARDRVMYNFIAWPSANTAGQGEMDLELLGGKTRRDQVMCPMYAPGTSTTTPIPLSNPPAAWNTGSDAGGPSLDLGSATAVNENSWVKPAGFDQTKQTKYTFDYSEDKIAWSADGKPYATYTKGSDDALWPYGEPMMLSFSIWTNAGADYDWMGGTYQYDEADPSAITITEIKFSGCVTNYEEATSGGSDNDHDQSQASGSGDGEGQGGGASITGESQGAGASESGAGEVSRASGSAGGAVSGDTGPSASGAAGSTSAGAGPGGQTSTVWVQPMGTTSQDDGEEETGTTNIGANDEDPTEEGGQEDSGDSQETGAASGSERSSDVADTDSSAQSFGGMTLALLAAAGLVFGVF